MNPDRSREESWQEELADLLRKQRRAVGDIAKEKKSFGWKAAIAATATLKARTTATNRWIGVALNMGGLHEVSRRVSAWQQQPNRSHPMLQYKLQSLNPSGRPG